MLAGRHGWLKAPPDSTNLKKLPVFPVTKKMRNIVKNDLQDRTDSELVHLFSNSSQGINFIKYPGHKKTIEGMIGYSYDFDVLKILLKGGSYTFRLITPLQSPSYPAIKILESFNEIDETTPNDHEKCSVYPAIANSEAVTYKEEATSSVVGYDVVNILDLTSFEDIDPKDNGSYRSQVVSDTFTSTVLIYLKIFGNKKPDPLNWDFGFGEYGSIGKYFLEILDAEDYSSDTDSGKEYILNTGVVPSCVPKNFMICRGNYVEKFFIEKTLSSNGGTEDPNGAHFLEVPVWIPDGDGSTGHIVNQKFLVYGPTIPTPSVEEANKFYLQVVDAGVIKKQEFILGKLS